MTVRGSGMHHVNDSSHKDRNTCVCACVLGGVRVKETHTVALFKLLLMCVCCIYSVLYREDNLTEAF